MIRKAIARTAKIISVVNCIVFSTTLVVVDRVVPGEMLRELADKAVRRVMVKIGDTVGMVLVENAVLSTTKFVGSVGDKVTDGIHSALAAARKKLLS